MWRAVPQLTLCGFGVDAVRLHELENWELDPERAATTTYLINILQKFQIHAATSAYKIAGGIDASKHGAIAAKQIPIGREFAQKIQKTFVDSLYALLDGLEKLSRSDYSPPLTASIDATIMVPTRALPAVDPNDRVSSVHPLPIACLLRLLEPSFRIRGCSSLPPLLGICANRSYLAWSTSWNQL